MPLQQQQNLVQQNADNLTEINNNVSENGTKSFEYKVNYKADTNDNHLKNPPPPPAPYGPTTNSGCKVSPLQIAANLVSNENQQSVVKSDLSPVSEEDLVSFNLI